MERDFAVPQGENQGYRMHVQIFHPPGPQKPGLKAFSTCGHRRAAPLCPDMSRIR